MQMICPQCGSTNVTVQMTTDTHTKSRGLIYWLLIGWWWALVKFFLLFGWLTFFLPNRRKIVTTQVKHGVYQACGYSWKME